MANNSDEEYYAALARFRQLFILAGVPWPEYDEEILDFKADPPWYHELDYLWDVRD